MNQIPTQHVSDILKAVTDPFSLLALIVLVLGWVGLFVDQVDSVEIQEPGPLASTDCAFHHRSVFRRSCF